MRIHALLVATGISVGAVATASAEEMSFEERVRVFILDNPEVILEALNVLAEREAKAATAAKLTSFPELFTDPARLGEGDATAPLRVVEFFDYKCIPCKAVHPQLVELVDAYPSIRIEMRHLPILSPGSERAARFALAAEAAYGAKAYGEVHERLWEIRGPLNAAGFQRVAEELDLDYDKIEAGMESEAIDARINYNRDVAIALEVLGTPAFVTKDSVAFGSIDIEALAQVWLSQ